MKLAIVYDWLDKWGGVERVLLTLHQMFPQADFYTSYFDQEQAPWAKSMRIHQSFIQKLPAWIQHNRLLSLPFYPFAFESFNFSGYDIVISVTSSFAKGIVTKPETYHLCYLLTPTRFLWSHNETYLQNPIIRALSSSYVRGLRNWDFVAAQRPDKIVSISQTVAKRAEKYYGCNSNVLYPPFDLSYWNEIKEKSLKNTQVSKKKYFLVVSRLERYKKVELVVKTFNDLPDRNLIVVGKGTEEQNLKQLAKSNTQFMKNLSDKELSVMYMNAEALIMPQEEDFGYVSLEAQFFGCPVISFNVGGARETIVKDKTGIFFEAQNTTSLREALARFHTISYNLKTQTETEGTKHLSQFSREKFQKQFQTFLVR